MKRNKILTWVVTSFGILGICFSTFLIFSTTVHGACSAEIKCKDGTKVYCEISGGASGSCDSDETTKCVKCTGAEKVCCTNGGEELPD